MKYDPKKHHRRSIRLKGYDYSQAGAYFITICCKDMKYHFGKIENGAMILSEFGQIAFDEWVKLGERFANFELDVFQIMPNHMHGVAVLVDIGGKSNYTERDIEMNFNHTKPTDTPASMSDMMGAYKSIVSNECLKVWKSQWTGVGPAPQMGKLWHRNLYEHIIRNESSYQRISNYIINNPTNWKDDKFFNG